MPTKAQLTKTLEGMEELVKMQTERIEEMKELFAKQTEIQLYMKCRIMELKAQRLDLPKSVKAWKEQTDTLYEASKNRNIQLRKREKMLIRNLKQVEDCILFAPRGECKKRYEEMEKPLTKLFDDLD